MRASSFVLARLFQDAMPCTTCSDIYYADLTVPTGMTLAQAISGDRRSHRLEQMIAWDIQYLWALAPRSSSLSVVILNDFAMAGSLFLLQDMYRKLWACPAGSRCGSLSECSRIVPALTPHHAIQTDS